MKNLMIQKITSSTDKMLTSHQTIFYYTTIYCHP